MGFNGKKVFLNLLASALVLASSTSCGKLAVNGENLALEKPQAKEITTYNEPKSFETKGWATWVLKKIGEQASESIFKKTVKKAGKEVAKEVIKDQFNNKNCGSSSYYSDLIGRCVSYNAYGI